MCKEKNVLGKALKDYGYLHSGMSEVSSEDAAAMFNDDKEVYLLYSDNSESLAVSLEHIKEHVEDGGMLGVEVKKCQNNCKSKCR